MKCNITILEEAKRADDDVWHEYIHKVEPDDQQFLTYGRYMALMLVRLRHKYNNLTHKPYIRLVGDGELAYCDRCKGGEVELEDESCDERVARRQKENEQALGGTI